MVPLIDELLSVLSNQYVVAGINKIICFIIILCLLFFLNKFIFSHALISPPYWWLYNPYVPNFCAEISGSITTTLNYYYFCKAQDMRKTVSSQTSNACIYILTCGTLHNKQHCATWRKWTKCISFQPVENRPLWSSMLNELDSTTEGSLQFFEIGKSV